MDDGTLRAGSEATAYRVVTDATKRGMTASLAASFITPLYAHPAAPAAQGDAEDAARYRWLRELRAHANPPIHGSVWVVKYHQQPGTIPELLSAGFGEVLDATIDADRAARAAKEWSAREQNA